VDDALDATRRLDFRVVEKEVSLAGMKRSRHHEQQDDAEGCAATHTVVTVRPPALLAFHAPRSRPTLPGMRTICLVIACALLLCPPALRAAGKLNVLFVAVDDLRPELNCYGATHVMSPNIDALAASGLRFDRAYCQLALCNPSRSSLLSGRRVETTGIFDLKTNMRDTYPDLVTLPEMFKNNGYRTLSFGKIFHTGNGNHDDPKSFSEKPWHPGAPTGAAAQTRPTPTDPDADPDADLLPAQSFDCADEDLQDGKTATKVVEALREHKDKPFFIGCGFHKPHMPFVSPKRYWDLYDPARIKLATNQHLPADTPAFVSNDASELRRYKGMPKKGPIPDDVQRHLLHGYYAATSFMDAQLGRVMAALDELGLRDRTIVILWGDHGYQLGEHGTWNKRTNWEIATRVPLIVSTPAMTATRGKSSAALVEFVDIYPTLAELCGLTPPDKLEGTSFTPLLADPQTPWKPAAFSVYQKPVKELGGPTLGRAMRTERYRYIEWKAKGGDQVVRELYDEQTDPQEMQNLANQPEHAQLVAKLSKQLADGWRAAMPAK
jgi:arylsulfatase A-like enzyme